MGKATDQDTVVELPINYIMPDPLGNDRKVFNRQALLELAWSIHDAGLAQPITVRPWAGSSEPIERNDLGVPTVTLTPHYTLVAGERRWRAHLLMTDLIMSGEAAASEKMRTGFIRAIVRELDDDAALKIMFTENIHREDLDPMSEAEAYERRMRVGSYSVGKVAKEAKVGVDRVKLALKLLRLAPELRELVRQGQLKPNIAREIADLDFDGQRGVMTWMSKQKHPPSADQISGHVTRLIEDKMQGNMFGDLGDVYAPAVRRAAQEGKFLEYLPVLDALPDLPIPHGKMGVILDAYIAQLIEEGHDQPASVLLDFWRKLLRRNHAVVNVFDSKTLPLLEKLGTDPAGRKRDLPAVEANQIVWASITSDNIPTQGMVLSVSLSHVQIRSTRTKKAYSVAREDVMIRPPVGIGRIVFTVIDDEVERGTVEEITETGIKFRLLKNQRVVDVPDIMIHYTATNARETILQRTED